MIRGAVDRKKQAARRNAERSPLIAPVRGHIQTPVFTAEFIASAERELKKNQTRERRLSLKSIARILRCGEKKLDYAIKTISRLRVLTYTPKDYERMRSRYEAAMAIAVDPKVDSVYKTISHWGMFAE